MNRDLRDDAASWVRPRRLILAGFVLSAFAVGAVVVSSARGGSPASCPPAPAQAVGVRATPRDSGVTVTLPESGVVTPRLSLFLEDVRVGGILIAAGGEAPRRDLGEGRFSFARGAVEERYTVRPAEVEQDFVISALPARGDLVVTQSLETNAAMPAAAGPAPSLELACGSASFLISRAVAIDAAGRRLPLDLELADGRLRMTVPAAWVEAATLPIVIDPIVGGQILVAQSTGLQRWDVAGGPNGWVAVWVDGFYTSWTLYASPITAAGAAGPGTVVNSGTSVGNASIAYSAFLNRYLVVWPEYSPTGQFTMYGRFLDGNGQVFGAKFTIATYVVAGNASQAVAADASGNFMVVIQYGQEIDGAIVASTGLVGARPVVQTTGAYTGPQVAFSNGEYLVTWQDNSGVRARGLSAAGALLTPVTTISATPAGSYPLLTGTSTGNNQFLVCWNEGPAAGLTVAVMGRIVTANSASTLGYAGAPITISPITGGLSNCIPTWSSLSSQWFLLMAANDQSITSVLMAPSGSMSARTQIAAPQAYSAATAWCSGSNDVLTLFQPSTSPTYPTPRILGQRFNIGPVPPPAPTNLQATAGDTKVTLSWGASAGATGYKIFRATSSGAYGATPVTTVTGTSFVDTGLTNGMTYFYVVKATNATGDSPSSNEVQARPVPPPPPTPTGLTAAPGNAQVVLSWTAAPGASAYYLKRSTTSGGPYTIIQGQSSTSYTDVTVSNGTTYYYVVSAFNLGGESPNSAQVSAMPVLPPAGITSVTSTTLDGSYKAGAVINVTVTFTEPMTLAGGNLLVTLNTGAVVTIPPFGPALTASGSYTVAAGQNTSDLTANSPLALSAGTLRNAAGQNTNLAIPTTKNIADSKAIVIDTTAPTILNVTSTTANGTYTTGAAINITVTFKEPVTLAGGNLLVTLSTGSVVSLTPFTLSSTRAGTYTVLAGQSSPDLNAVTPLVLAAGATIKDKAGNLLTSLAVPTGSNLADLKAIVIYGVPAPVLTTPNNKKTNDNTPVITGTAIPNATVSVFFNGSTTAEGTTTASATGTWSYHNLGAVKADGTYTVAAKASDGVITSPSSPAITLIVDTICRAPDNLTATPKNGAIDLEWSPSPDPDVVGYRIYRSTTGPTGTFTLLTSATQLVTATKYRDSSLTNGQSYSYKVAAVDNAVNEKH